MQIIGRLVLPLLVAVCASAIPAQAEDDSGPYDIMKPEPTQPGVIPPYKSPRGTRQHVVIPKPARPAPRRIPDMPPPVIAPRTGQSLPNIPPPAPGSGPGGRETFQDRATRCVHQSGVYGQTGADQQSYIATCIGQ